MNQQEPLPLKDQMEYAMKHFLFIADQRLKTFHLYVLLAVASVGATLNAANNVAASGYYILPFAGALHISIAIIFGVIEIRNCRLLTIARNGIMEIEKQPGWPTYARLATTDKDGSSRFLTYWTVFRLAYISQIAIGIICIIAGLVLGLMHYLPRGQHQESKAVTPTVTNKNATTPPTTIQGDTLDSADSKSD